MERNYRCVREEAADEIVEKKSRFIATVCPAATEAEALAFVARMKEKYRDATHNVHAYVLRENHVERFSDDGEPSGTAGIPVLDVIKKEGLVDTAVVVTRYFGGTLLGAGGLVRAYGKAARQGILAAGTAEMVPSDRLELRLPYELYGPVGYHIKTEGYEETDAQFSEGVTLSVWVPCEDAQRFAKSVTELTNGAVHPTAVETKFLPKKEEEA